MLGWAGFTSVMNSFLSLTTSSCRGRQVRTPASPKSLHRTVRGRLVSLSGPDQVLATGRVVVLPCDTLTLYVLTQRWKKTSMARQPATGAGLVTLANMPSLAIEYMSGNENSLAAMSSRSAALASDSSGVSMQPVTASVDGSFMLQLGLSRAVYWKLTLLRLSGTTQLAGAGGPVVTCRSGVMSFCCTQTPRLWNGGKVQLPVGHDTARFCTGVESGVRKVPMMVHMPDIRVEREVPFGSYPHALTAGAVTLVMSFTDAIRVVYEMTCWVMGEESTLNTVTKAPRLATFL